MREGDDTGNAEVVVWRVDLSVPNDTYALCQRCIDENERARADRFVYERDRRRFTVSHAALRIVLGDTLGVRPLEVRFSEGPHGRPLLVSSPLQFSLSHSHDRCLIGVAREGLIGVDIEEKRPEVDCQAIADRFFTQLEADMVRDAGEPSRAELFFALWARKEAYLKATGLGLHGSLTALQCAADADGNLRIAAVEGSADAGRDWTMLSLDEDMFAACAMIEGSTRGCQIREFVWRPSRLYTAGPHE